MSNLSTHARWRVNGFLIGILLAMHLFSSSAMALDGLSDRRIFNMVAATMLSALDGDRVIRDPYDWQILKYHRRLKLVADVISKQSRGVSLQTKEERAVADLLRGACHYRWVGEKNDFEKFSDAEKMGQLTAALADCHTVFKNIFSASQTARSQASGSCHPAIESQRRSRFKAIESALEGLLYSETTVVGWARQQAQNALESYRVINRFRQTHNSMPVDQVHRGLQWTQNLYDRDFVIQPWEQFCLKSQSPPKECPSAMRDLREDLDHFRNVEHPSIQSLLCVLMKSDSVRAERSYVPEFLEIYLRYSKSKANRDEPKTSTLGIRG